MPDDGKHEPARIFLDPHKKSMSTKPAKPPNPVREDGETRRVGVEVEFAGVEARSAAKLVSDLYGGGIDEESPHRLVVETSRWGPFTVELDTKHAHPDPDRRLAALAKSADGEWAEKGVEAAKDLDQSARELLGDAVSGIVPTEIACPPIPWPKLGALDGLFDGLRERGAEGTDANPAYGFGLQLNPEVAEEGAGYIVAHLRAFLLLVEQLREEIDVDLTRRILPHSDPFPEPYQRRILDGDYRPDLAALIDDYLKDNPTRNRDLDLLPLFAHLASDRVFGVLDDDRIKPRPTFHYRLPNSRIDEPGWTAVTEWNRWVKVEELAADPEKLADLAKTRLGELSRPAPVRWLAAAKAWFGQ